MKYKEGRLRYSSSQIHRIIIKLSCLYIYLKRIRVLYNVKWISGNRITAKNSPECAYGTKSECTFVSRQKNTDKIHPKNIFQEKNIFMVYICQYSVHN